MPQRDNGIARKPNIQQDILQLLPSLHAMTSGVQIANWPAPSHNRLEAILDMLTRLFGGLQCELSIWRLLEDEDAAINGQAELLTWDRATHQISRSVRPPNWDQRIYAIIRDGNFFLEDLDKGLSRLVMRGIVPALKSSDEVSLVFDIRQIYGNKWENPTAVLLESIIGMWLDGLRFSDLLGAYETLDKLIDGGVSHEELSSAAENILYLKSRRSESKSPSETSPGSTEWSLEQQYQSWNHPKTRLALDEEDDWVAAILIQSLISQVAGQDASAVERLLDLFKDFLSPKTSAPCSASNPELVLEQRRGPKLVLVPARFRSWYSVSEALARLASVDNKSLPSSQDIQNRIKATDFLNVAAIIREAGEAKHAK